jgi:hypothetical protein
MSYKRSLLAIVVLVALISTGYMLADARSIVTAALFKQIPSVSALAQADAPLSISAITVNAASTPLEPKLDYVLTNVSGKSIHAYAVRYIVLHGGQRSEGVILRTDIPTNSLLQSGHSESGSVASGTYSETVESIQLIVDFVALDDGLTWGVDRFKSAERLSGQRAGAQEETNRLLKLINEKKVEVTTQIFAADGSEITLSTGHSPEWRDGFREGVNFKRGRLKRVYLKEGSSGVVNELKRSSNAMEGKQK